MGTARRPAPALLPLGEAAVRGAASGLWALGSAAGAECGLVSPRGRPGGPEDAGCAGAALGLPLSSLSSGRTCPAEEASAQLGPQCPRRSVFLSAVSTWAAWEARRPVWCPKPPFYASVLVSSMCAPHPTCSEEAWDPGSGHSGGCTHLGVCMCAHTRPCMYVSIHTCTHACAYIYSCLCMNTRVCGVLDLCLSCVFREVLESWPFSGVWGPPRFSRSPVRQPHGLP